MKIGITLPLIALITLVLSTVPSNGDDTVLQFETSGDREQDIIHLEEAEEVKRVESSNDQVPAGTDNKSNSSATKMQMSIGEDGNICCLDPSYPGCPYSPNDCDKE